MFILSGANDKLQIVTSTAADVDVLLSYAHNASGTITTDSNPFNINTATTTDILTAPGAGNTRKVKMLSVVNKHASLTNDVYVQMTDGTNTVRLTPAITLQPDEGFLYVEGEGLVVFDTNGAQKQTTIGNTSALMSSIEDDTGQRTFESTLPKVAPGTFVLVTNTGYAVYLGRTTKDITVKFVEFHVSTAGAGAQTAEVGLFSSPLAPNKTGQTLTKLVATGTVDTLTTTGAKRNTSAFNQVVPANTHLWAVIRTAMATTQPTILGLSSDMSQGRILSTATPGALTGLSTMAGALIAISTATVCPDLRVTLD